MNLSPNLKSWLFLVSLGGILYLSPIPISAQIEQYCPGDLREVPRVSSLPGVMVFKEINAPSWVDGVETYFMSILDGATPQINLLDNLPNHFFMAMSSDGRWLFTYEPPRESEDNLSRIWMNDLSEQREPVLLHLSSFAYSPIRHGYLKWINEETLVLNWYDSKEKTTKGVMVRPFENPIQYIIPAESFGDWHITSYSPVGSQVLLQQERTFATLDIKTGSIVPLDATPYAPYPTWSPSGRLAYVASLQGVDELFIRDFHTNTDTQISYFTEALGKADIVIELEWSPNDQFIAFAMAPRTELEIGHGPGATTHIIDTYSGEIFSLCDLPDSYVGNRDLYFWSPDSVYLAFEKDHNILVFDMSSHTYSIAVEDTITIFDWR